MAEVNNLDANGKVVPGVTWFRDPFTGERVEVEQVLRPEDLGRFTHGYHRGGGSAEKCALYAGTGMGRGKDMRR